MRHHFLKVWLVVALSLGAALGGCDRLSALNPIAPTAATGDVVQVDYTLTLSDGTVADTSEGRVPLEFELGSGQVVPGFDQGVLGLRVGESKTFTVPAAEGYGDPNPDLTTELSREEVGLAEAELEVGMSLGLMSPSGPVPVQIIAVDDDTVTIDANHPLAGEDLTFAVTLVAINPETVLDTLESGEERLPEAAPAQ